MSQGEGGGHPLSFKSAVALDKAIQEYFRIKDEAGISYTVSGLADHLGVDRTTLWNYSKCKSPKYKKFFNIIKSALRRIMARFEESAVTTPAGLIFVMKNYGYSDQQNIDQEDDREVKTFKVVVEPSRELSDEHKKLLNIPI